MARAVQKVVISNALIIKALNPPTKPVGRWSDSLAKDVHRIAVRTAPVNNPLSALHRGGVVGTYRASLKWDRRGTNGHFVRRRVYSRAPHASIVENGRRSTVGGRWERFYWAVVPGVPLATKGTRGRPGRHVLERAFAAAMWRKRRVFPDAVMRRI